MHEKESERGQQAYQRASPYNTNSGYSAGRLQNIQ